MNSSTANSETRRTEQIVPQSEAGPTERKAAHGWGGALLGTTVAGLLVCTILLTFFAAPLALAVLALVPFAILGAWLFKRGRSRRAPGRPHASV